MAGSVPGDEGREPRWEPTSLPITLSAYEIDRLPYPNDPASTTAHRLVPQKDAARLCACARRAPLLPSWNGRYACKGGAWRRLRLGRRLGPGVHPRTGYLQLGNWCTWDWAPSGSGPRATSCRSRKTIAPARGPGAARSAPARPITAARIAHRASRPPRTRGPRLSLLHRSGQYRNHTRAQARSHRAQDRRSSPAGSRDFCDDPPASFRRIVDPLFQRARRHRHRACVKARPRKGPPTRRIHAHHEPAALESCTG